MPEDWNDRQQKKIDELKAKIDALETENIKLDNTMKWWRFAAVIAIPAVLVLLYCLIAQKEYIEALHGIIDKRVELHKEPLGLFEVKDLDKYEQVSGINESNALVKTK